MKKRIILIIFGIFFNTLHAQVLYTENFDSYTAGNLGTDPTGVTPGKGGWYTKIINRDPNLPALPVTNASIQVVGEANRGNVLQIAALVAISEVERHIFRDDLKTFWQNRTPGNNVLKLSYELFTGEDKETQINVNLLSDEGLLFFFGLGHDTGAILRGTGTGSRGLYDLMSNGPALYQNNQTVRLPSNTWLTMEVYLDYNNSKVYFSIPALNFVAVKNTIPYDLNNTEYDDWPAKLHIVAFKRVAANTSPTPYTPKLDNINISAQNTVPTVGISEVFASQFNLYPNPASTIVTIANNTNTYVQKVMVYDMAGELLNTKSFNNEIEIQLNVENLPNGTYILHIQTTEGTAVKKLVKK